MSAVVDVYNQIAKSFSRTRYKKWKSVEDFLEVVQPTDKILELGCGNGKNLMDHKEQSIGVDISEELCKICEERGIRTICGDILEIELEEESYDHILCIAVIHHFQKKEDQIRLIQKIYRLLKPGGRAIITGWNVSEPHYSFSPGDNYVKFGHSQRYYYIYHVGELKELIESTIEPKHIDYRNENGNDTIFLVK